MQYGPVGRRGFNRIVRIGQRQLCQGKQGFRARPEHGPNREIDIIRNQLARNHVAMLVGTAKFVDDHTISVESDSGTSTLIGGDKFVIGVGTKPARPSTVEFDGVPVGV